MEEILDLLIIGAGPAGMTAAIYASRSNLKFKIIDKLAPGGQMIKTDVIENYPGFVKISGFELTMKFVEHLDKFGIKIEIEEATEIIKEEYYKIITKSGKSYISKKIIIATGVISRKLNVPGEEKFAGKGISFCSTCDGFLYKDKIVVVVGKGNSALSSAIFLSKIAKKVYLINKDSDFKNKGKLFETLINIPNIEIKYFSKVIEIVGNNKIEYITIKNKEGIEEKIKTDGVFVLIGNIPNSKLVEGLSEVCIKKEILVDKNMKTSQDGIYAIGDVITKSVRQIVTAMSDASIAIENIQNS